MNCFQTDIASVKITLSLVKNLSLLLIEYKVTMTNLGEENLSRWHSLSKKEILRHVAAQIAIQVPQKAILL
ncbi:hypothetical protein HMPREF9999_00565 [Alloprevotella sp. oral taxon 473 str. F0040]|nr:hypothetical protein HMPREF9999_00565 [Alloprevotella sp. oral taxon 473 str. F0040]